VPTIDPQMSCKTVGTLRFAHPTARASGDGF
jgi:hypothetical protein